MTATAAAAPSRISSGRPPELAVARRAFRQVRIGSAVLAVVFGVSAYATASAYAATYPTESSRQEAAAVVSGDAGLRILLGPISDIATVGGYLVYKNFVFLTIVGGVWAVLAGTRVLRGEEDAGRWQLVLSGGTRPSRATAATLAALALAVIVIFAATTGVTLLAGRDPDLALAPADTVLYGLSLALVPAVSAALGAFTSQLGRTRRVATGLGLTILGVAFVLRMIADTGPSTHWLLWATPFGWTELMRPFTENDMRPLVPAALTVLALSVAAVVLAGRRDAGQGVLAGRDAGPPRAAGLGSPFGMSLRLELPVLAAWCLGACAAGLALGVFAEVTTSKLPASLGDNLGKYGVQGSFTDQFLGVVFLLIATVVALLPAGQMGAAAAEETSGRLLHLLARPVRRSTWLLGRLALCLAAVVIAGLLGGLGIWLGASTQDLHLGLAGLLGAGLNVVPTALVALGVGAVMLSVAPRAAAWAVYVLVVGSVFVDLLAPLLSGAGWSDRLSLFHYMALMPGEAADGTTIAAVTGMGLLLCALATVLFDRRDVRAT